MSCTHTVLRRQYPTWVMPSVFHAQCCRPVCSYRQPVPSDWRRSCWSPSWIHELRGIKRLRHRQRIDNGLQPVLITCKYAHPCSSHAVCCHQPPQSKGCSERASSWCCLYFPNLPRSSAPGLPQEAEGAGQPQRPAKQCPNVSGCAAPVWQRQNSHWQQAKQREFKRLRARVQKIRRPKLDACRGRGVHAGSLRGCHTDG